MTAQISNIIKPLHEMTEEELLAKIREIRTNKYRERPAAKQHVKKEAKATAKGVLKGMSREDLIKLLQEQLDL